MTPDRARRWVAAGVAGRVRAAVLVGGVGVVALVAGAGRAEAHAKLIDLHASALAGGAIGDGSAPGGRDFYRQTRGPGFGGEVGARLLILDASIRFVQMVGANGREGTLLSMLLGPSVEIPVKEGGKDASGHDRGPLVVVRPGFAVGFGFGTPAPVMLPLNDAQISAKGLLIVGRFGVERLFGPVFGLGAEVQGGYHYFFGGVINDASTHSSGWQLAGFGTMSVHFGI